jgi:UDP-glucose 4-epimerase
MAPRRPILVTGAAGFIGAHVSAYLEGRGIPILRHVRPASRGRDVQAPNTIALELPSQELGKILERHQPDVVIHCAGTSSVGQSFEQPGLDFAANVGVTESLLAALEKHAPTTRFLFLSSAAVYGNPQRLPISETTPVAPISPYGVHKAAAEMLCGYYARVHGIPTLNLRLFSTYGRGLTRQVLWDICQSWKRSGEIVLSGTGYETRDLLHVSDVVRAIELVIQHVPFNGRAVNVASGTSVSISALASMILARLGGGSVRFTGASRHGDPKCWQADIQRVSQLGFRPAMALAEGVSDYVDWVRREPS